MEDARATLYHGTKFAVEDIWEALSFEMVAIGVRVKVFEPGLVATDFNSRSIDVSNDPSIEEYQGIVKAMESGVASGDGYWSGRHLPAEVIFRAATDESDRLRYPSGDDAHESGKRLGGDDAEAYLRERIARFGLGSG